MPIFEIDSSLLVFQATFVTFMREFEHHLEFRILVSIHRKRRGATFLLSLSTEIEERASRAATSGGGIQRLRHSCSS
jgi:hypothetical protein